MLAADLDCHSASGLASHRLPYEIGKRPHSLFLSRFNVRQDHPFLIGNELIIANVKKISHRAGCPYDSLPIDSTVEALSLRRLLSSSC
jgi:hypothetical protein